MSNINFSGRHRFLNKEERRKLRVLLNAIAKNKGSYIHELNYVFLTDDELLLLNIEHLNHDTYTDIITFDLSNSDSSGIDGEIYISKDRVTENSKNHGADNKTEMTRVICHGLLHLLGYKDKSATEAKLMREEEEACLSLWLEL